MAKQKTSKQNYIWGISIIFFIIVTLLWLVLTLQPENYGLMAFFIIIIAVIMAVNSYRIIKYNTHIQPSVQVRTFRRDTYRPSQKKMEVCHDFYAYCPDCGLLRRENALVCGRCQAELPQKIIKGA